MTAHLETLGRWASEVTYDGLPAETRRAARSQVIDMVAAARAAVHSTEAASVAHQLDALATAGRCTVAGHSRKFGPIDAAVANAAYSMAHDFDDIVWMGHTCHSAVWASLAVAEHEGCDTRAFMTAVVVANEIAGRIGASTWLGPLNGQMVSFIHLAGAAAAAAKLLRLDAERTTHAMAIALMQPSFVLQPGFMVPTSKLLVAAAPTALGIRAAYLARGGMTGDARILEDRRGLWSRFSFVPLPVMLGELGQFWVTNTLTCKTYPGCHYFQTACEAIDIIRQRRGPLTLDNIDSVEIATTQLGRAVTTFAAEYAAAHDSIRPVNVNFDLRTTAAVMLHAGKLTTDELEPEWLARESAALVEWRRRIHARHDPNLTAKLIASGRSVSMGRHALRQLRLRDMPRLMRRFAEEYGARRPSAKEIGRFAVSLVRKRNGAGVAPRVNEGAQGTPLYFPNRVKVRFVDGREETEQIELPAGSFCNPHFDLALEGKFVQVMAPAIGAAAARAAFVTLLRDELPLSEFIDRCQLAGSPRSDIRDAAQSVT